MATGTIDHLSLLFPLSTQLGQLQPPHRMHSYWNSWLLGFLDCGLRVVSWCLGSAAVVLVYQSLHLGIKLPLHPSSDPIVPSSPSVAFHHSILLPGG